MMNRITLVAGLLLTAMLAAGCSQKEPASRAVEAAENALAAVSDEAQKYIPQRYAEVKAELDVARAALTEEKYADALDAVKDIPAKAAELGAEATAAREQLAAEMTGEWTRLTADLPGVLEGIDARFAELDKLPRLPQELDADAVERARKNTEIAKFGWNQAVEAFDAGNLEGAAARGLEVERLAQEIRQALGLEPRAEDSAAT